MNLKLIETAIHNKTDLKADYLNRSEIMINGIHIRIESKRIYTQKWNARYDGVLSFIWVLLVYKILPVGQRVAFEIYNEYTFLIKQLN